MRRAAIYLSYGMPKSGSTLAFELARTILEQAGVPQHKLAGGATHPGHPINFVRDMNGEAIGKLADAIPPGAGPVVIKTHSHLFPKVGRMLEDGRLTGHAVWRDPRDIALSMLDAAREGRAWGSGPSGPFRVVADTLPMLRQQVNAFEQWSACRGVIALNYEQLAFDTPAAAQRIAAQLGVQVDLKTVVRIVLTERFTQRNRGLRARWKSEMAAADAELVATEFAGFLERRGVSGSGT